MNPHAAIHGQGVAAACSASLLQRAGFSVSLMPRNSPRVPAIVISEATQALACDVFAQPALFNGLPAITRRIAAWGPGNSPVSFPHSAIVISEQALLDRLAAPDAVPPGDAEWSIFASRPLPEIIAVRPFGSRQAFAAAVECNSPEASACWVESLELGWLFLIPGWVIAVGAPPEALLAQSRLVAKEIRSAPGEAAAFPAFPRIADPLCAPGILTCGAAAMAFDPICGDGTGNAIREAILAAAVIRAAARGEDTDALLVHYQTRLLAGFQRHLQMTLEFYRAANAGAWWEEEIREMERGVEWCAQQLAAAPAFRYRLEGFDLVPVNAG
jgi:2-polyprenyl-6-methoxyphenol hydroxylase-like FAD-dependent oxidoreductase